MATAKSKNFLDAVLAKHSIPTPRNYNQLLLLCSAAIDDGKFNKQNIAKNIIKPWAEQEIEGDLVDRYTKVLSLGRGVIKEKLCLIYGQDEGTKRWVSYVEQHRFKNTFEGKQAKYDWTAEQFVAYNQSRAVTLDNLIKKYGNEDGHKRWLSYVKKQKVNGSTLEWFIAKHGEIVGPEIYESVCAAKAQTLSNYIAKHGPVKGQAKFDHYNSNTRSTFSSTSSMNFFSEVDSILKLKSPQYQSLSVYFAPKNKEFCKYDENSKRVYFYDYAVPAAKIIVEYNGDLFHANPQIYAHTDVPAFRGNVLPASEIWARDAVKRKVAESHSFDVIYVWEKDVITNRSLEINKVVNEIYNRIHKLHH